MSKSSRSNEETNNDLPIFTLIGSVFLILTMYLLYKIIKTILKNRNELNNKKFLNCECKKCKERVQIHHKKLYFTNIKTSYKLIIVLVFTIYISYSCLSYVKSENEKLNYKDFDPYETLNVSYSDDIPSIKRAYRNIVKTKHPDRLLKQDMSQEEKDHIRLQFRLIVKAYEILTDPEKKENWEKYGDPDGPKRGLSIILPSFIISKKFELPFLIIFLLFIMIILPIYVIFVLNKKESEYDENGLSKTNNSIYYYFINENLHTKQIPFILGLSIEFKDMKINSFEEKELSQLWTFCNSYIPKAKSDKIPFGNKKAITLLYHWLNRNENISEFLKEETKFVVSKSIEIYPNVLKFLNMMTEAKKINKKIKTFGYFCSKTLIECSQLLHQRLFFDYSPYMQLPFITVEAISSYIKKKKKGTFSFKDFIYNASDEEKKETIQKFELKNELNDEEIKEILLVSKAFPSYQIEVKAYVNGFNEIVVNDFITIEIEIKRKGKIEGEAEDFLIGMSHSSFIDDYFIEKAAVLCSEVSEKDEENKKLINIQYVDTTKSSISLKFMYQVDEARDFQFQIDCLSLNFSGIDVSRTVKVSVLKRSDERKEFFKKLEEIEKKENYNEVSSVNKFIQSFAGVVDDNEIEGSDDEENIKNKKKK